MSKKVVVLLFTILSVSFLSVQAQKKEKMTKQRKKELKALKKELKKMDPLKFRDQYEKWQILKGEKPALERKMEEVNNQKASVKNKISSIQKEIDRVKGECDKKKDLSQNEGENSTGTVFKVQIGDIGAYKIPEDLKSEYKKADKDGSLKFTLGYFKVEKEGDEQAYLEKQAEAEALRKFLKSVGIAHATVIVYKNNVRANSDDLGGGEDEDEENDGSDD